ncbi:hypothetical protein C0993_010581 [Termitomyces sp. T159_Od127]|nr:hypothetical protein C0993_010581 [Termitomyces sp. T159_Od127]
MVLVSFNNHTKFLTLNSKSFPHDVYKPGTRFRLTLPEHDESMEVQILKAFTPFTNAAALLVKPGPSVLRLPARFVLKLADRRVSKDWNFDREQDYQESLRSHIDTSGTITFPDDHDETDPAWMSMLERWNYFEHGLSNECEAYECLSEAQALGLVPRVFGTAQLKMDESACHSSLTHINGLLLEYIEGRTMASYQPGINLSLEEAEVISQRVLQLGRDLRRYGVSHNDINLHNVIIRSENHCPVLIDWARACVELTNQPLEQRWTDQSMWQDFNWDIRWMLRHGNDNDVLVAGGVWHRYRTPISDIEQCRRAYNAGWGVINQGISNLSSEERERFYDEDKSADDNHELRWKVKKGIRTRLDDDPVPRM